jgi:hypothetical protein
MTIEVPKTYTVVSTNCDCASGRTAVTTNPNRWLMGPRCPFCHTVLGIMQYNILGTVLASYREEALRKYDKICPTCKGTKFTDIYRGPDFGYKCEQCNGSGKQ